MLGAKLKLSYKIRHGNEDTVGVQPFRPHLGPACDGPAGVDAGVELREWVCPAGQQTAIRFCLLAIAKAKHQASGIADIRKRISGNAVQISFAA